MISLPTSLLLRIFMHNVITFFNKKGGTGKTSLAFSIAKDLNYPLLSNDDSVIEEIYPNKAKIMDKVELIEHDVVYDLGGYIDPGIIDIFKGSHAIVVPTTLDINSIKRTINTVMEVHRYCDNILIIINRVKQSKLEKYKQSLQALEGLGKDIIHLRESEIITNSIHSGKTITELYGESGLTKSQYKGVFQDYAKIIKWLKKVDEVEEYGI